jgi:hypothetical protein
LGWDEREKRKRQQKNSKVRKKKNIKIKKGTKRLGRSEGREEREAFLGLFCVKKITSFCACFLLQNCMLFKEEVGRTKKRWEKFSP